MFRDDGNQMDQLVSTICGMVSIPNKIDNRIHIPLSSPEPLYFVYDHCFSLAGKGCVMTGTIQSGRIAINDEIEFPSLHIMRKVKSIQMFHKNIDCAYKGDRAGVCVQYGFLLDYQPIVRLQDGTRRGVFRWLSLVDADHSHSIA